jgi:hypothetical protein
MTDRRPPRDITPARFFEQWLPALFAGEFGPGKRTPTDVTVRVRLDGEGGGAWDLTVAGGKLTVGAPGGSEPPVSVHQTVADWRAVTVGEEGGIDLAPPQGSPLDMLFVDPASRQVLTSVRGTVRFEVTGYNGRTWQLTCKFGEQPEPPEPNAVISVDAETHAKILSRQMAPPEAYFSGKVRLSGDTGLAMQLGMAMMPRFS